MYFTHERMVQPNNALSWTNYLYISLHFWRFCLKDLLQTTAADIFFQTSFEELTNPDFSNGFGLFFNVFFIIHRIVYRSNSKRWMSWPFSRLSLLCLPCSLENNFLLEAEWAESLLPSFDFDVTFCPWLRYCFTITWDQIFVQTWTWNNAAETRDETYVLLLCQKKSVKGRANVKNSFD